MIHVCCTVVLVLIVCSTTSALRQLGATTIAKHHSHSRLHAQHQPLESQLTAAAARFRKLSTIAIISSSLFVPVLPTIHSAQLAQAAEPATEQKAKPTPKNVRDKPSRKLADEVALETSISNKARDQAVYNELSKDIKGLENSVKAAKKEIAQLEAKANQLATKSKRKELSATVREKTVDEKYSTLDEIDTKKRKIKETELAVAQDKIKLDKYSKLLRVDDDLVKDKRVNLEQRKQRDQKELAEAARRQREQALVQAAQDKQKADKLLKLGIDSTKELKRELSNAGEQQKRQQDGIKKAEEELAKFTKEMQRCESQLAAAKKVLADTDARAQELQAKLDAAERDVKSRIEAVTDQAKRLDRLKK